MEEEAESEENIKASSEEASPKDKTIVTQVVFCL
jgi:hypothetical protein